MIRRVVARVHRRIAGFGLVIPLLFAVPGCAPRTPAASPVAVVPVVATAGTALFRNVAEFSGVHFRHTNGAAGKFRFIESTPAGCAFVDIDNDGWLDIVLVQTGPVPGDSPSSGVRPHCALYHNNGDGTFRDTTTGSGLDRNLGYAHGVAVGDYDNDGFEDLFITGYGVNHLLHNERGSGRFTDITRAMKLAAPHGGGYATSAAWGDYDNDGRLDLYVCYYCPWTLDRDRRCNDSAGKQDYCSPQIYDPETHALYHNDGAGFTDVSERAGIAKVKGRGLAVAFTDYDGDGWPDIFVANDLTPNMLWHNNRNGTFTNMALETGCSQSEGGNVMAAMGVGVADFDHSGRDSLFVTNFSGMPNTLFKNANGKFFQDVSVAAGVAQPHIKFLSFGCEFMDYDADGWPDLIIADGHVQISAPRQMAGVTYAERKQLLHNEGNGRFREIADPGALGDLMNPAVSRGLAVGDFDNDGRVDALYNNQNGPAELFHNLDRSASHWVSFKAVGTKSNRDGVMARFTLRAGGMTQMATVRGGSSYLSSSDRRVYFGLGSSATIDSVQIRWPSGRVETLKIVSPDAIYVVTEGRGITGKLPVKANSGSRQIASGSGAGLARTGRP
jgi:hypothetical protein